MDTTELVTEFRDYWAGSCRPLTAMEAAYMFVEDFPDCGMAPDELVNAH